MRIFLLSVALLPALLLTPPAGAGGQEPPSGNDPQQGRVRLSFEAKAHFRESQGLRLPSPFTGLPEDRLSPGDSRLFLETVNEGSHIEISTLTLYLDFHWSDGIVAHAQVDVIDLYERNPTSEGDSIDVDEAWIRFGRESEPGIVPQRSGAYLKIGKFPHFERQDDRHLESYGLVSTAFNRLEDVGLEFGADLGRHLYLRASVTQGNPLFFRDPNALAGDNGIPLLLSPLPNPDPQLKSGFPIFYDAKVDGVDAAGDAELGAGLGLRFGHPSGQNGLDLLLWSYRRQLAETVELRGTFYGGDFDLLRGPFNSTPLPTTGDEKRETGGNLWIYNGGFSFFGQYVDQDLAGLDRIGYEAEVAWSFDLPLKWAVQGRQLFPWIAPAVRFSRLEPDFVLHPQYVAPSVRWEWDKTDLGIRLGILAGIDLTVEWTDNTFVVRGRDESVDELLTTLRFRL